MPRISINGTEKEQTSLQKKHKIKRQTSSRRHKRKKKEKEKHGKCTVYCQRVENRGPFRVENCHSKRSVSMNNSIKKVVVYLTP